MSFPGRILSSTSIFKPALHYLSVAASPAKKPDDGISPSLHPTISADLDDIDSSPPRPLNAPPTLRRWHSRDSSGELDPHNGAIPLIDYSRTSSPSPYKGSAAQSEDEDEGVGLSLRPLVEREWEVGRGRSLWRKWTKSENLGGFLFGTWTGWQVYVSLLVVWSFVLGFVLVLMNRFILWTGTYKFPYPLTHTWIQLAWTHAFLVLAASLTRAFVNPLRRLGFSSMVAPAFPLGATTGHSRSRKGLQRLNPFALAFSKTGGIAGGGLFEFDRSVARLVIPLVLVYTGKMVLSNISYAYAALPLYTLSRITTVPMTLIFTAFLARTSHSISTISITLVITLNLLIASIRKSERLIWESIVAGVFSTLFVSVYPIVLLRTHKKLIAHQVPPADVLTNWSDPGGTAPGQGTRQETRAYWTLLHYTSLLSLAFLTPLLLVSGEIPNILHNCYFMDVPWFWFLTMMGGLASFAVFSTTLAFCRATSPLSTEVIKLPRQAAQLIILERFRLPVHAWVGLSIVFAGSALFTWIRREEGRRWEVRRIGRVGR